MQQHVALDQFLRVRVAAGAVPAVLEEKARRLKEEHTCFDARPQTPQGGRRNHRWFGNGTSNANNNNRHNNNASKKTPPAGPSRTEVVKIGCKDLSRESLARKDFLALMNKLTEHNKSHVLQGVKNVYRDGCAPIYVDILRDIIQRNPDSLELYMEVLRALARASQNEALWHEQWKQRWDAYVSEKGWALREPREDENYDEFCDYVKLRKRTLATLRGWLHLNRSKWLRETCVVAELVPLVTSECDEVFGGTPGGSPLTDFYIESLQVIAGWQPDHRDLRAWSTRWHGRLPDLRPATRFKMLDLWESLHKKVT